MNSQLISIGEYVQLSLQQNFLPKSVVTQISNISFYGMVKKHTLLF